VLRNNVFYLAAVIDAPEATPFEAKDFLGVDLGVRNILFPLLDRSIWVNIDGRVLISPGSFCSPNIHQHKGSAHRLHAFRKD